MVFEQLDIHMKKYINLDTNLTPITKINSKQITDLNVKHKTIKLLKYNIGENLNNLGFGNDFLDTLPKSQYMKEIISEQIFIKIKNYYSLKEAIKRMKRQAIDQETSFAKDIWIKRCYSKYTKRP